jgi:large subunit ribosomal protein L1
MGKIRIKTLGVKELEKKERAEDKKRREAKKQKQTEDITNVVEVTQAQDIVAIESDQTLPLEGDATKKEKTPSQARKARTIGKNIKAAKKSINSEKKYPLEEAIKILKKVSYAKFDETVEVHINTKENNIKGEVLLPHGTGKALKIAVADDALLKKIEAGEIDFDVLISTPAFMSKLVPLARILGPKGLMPNPKAGTVTDNPAEAVKKFSGGAIRFKTEPKFPIVHQPVGKISFSEKQLAENITAFIGAVKSKDIQDVYLAGSMTPSVQLDVENL